MISLGCENWDDVKVGVNGCFRDEIELMEIIIYITLFILNNDIVLYCMMLK